ncbi:MAG: NCS1 family nucleobase:cation symporter-1 [Phycisphaerales bacterium JB043]
MSSSPITRDHAHQGLVNEDLRPVPLEARTWSMWNIAALWIGMSVCIPTYMLASSMISLGMSWWQALLTVMLGNLIVLVPMILNGHGGTKYGVPFPVLVRATFGISGAHIPTIARALVACGWFGIQSWIGGWAIYTALGAMDVIDIAADTNDLPLLGITALELTCFFVFWAINLAIVVVGINSIKWLETGAAPFLIACGLALLIWAFVKVDSISTLFNQPSRFESNADFWKVFFPQLTAMVGFWATLSLNIPDFTRYCRSQRDQAFGQALGLPTTMTLFCFIGITVTGATIVVFGEPIWDPVVLVSRLGAPWVVAVSMIALTIATLSTNLAANVVSPANGFSNIAPRRISFRTGAIITCLIGVIIMPWKLYNDLGAYIFTWLIGYSALLGPVAGVMLCDYFVLRRTRLDPDALYDPDGPYRGINHRAMIAMTIAVLPNIPGFIHAAADVAILPASAQDYFDQLYTYAWFVGLTIAGLLYFLLARTRVGPAPLDIPPGDES